MSKNQIDSKTATTRDAGGSTPLIAKKKAKRGKPEAVVVKPKAERDIRQDDVQGWHQQAMIDIALTEDENTGKPLAHKPDCPKVAEHRALERPIMRLYGVREPLPHDLRQHDCLKGAG